MDRIAGMVVLVIGMAILWYGRTLPTGSFHRPGPGFFPTVVAMGLIGLSLLLMIFGKRMGGDDHLLVPRPAFRTLAVFLALLAFFLFLEPLGFAISSFFLMLFLFLVIGSQRWYVAILGSILSVGFAFIVFGMLLKGNLPVGILGF